MAKTNRLGPLVAVIGLLAALGLLIALMMLVVEVKPAEAAFPGKNGRIAYVFHLEDGHHEIYTMKPNGTDRKQLTDNSAYDTSPTYSPDGTKIAFLRQQEGSVSKIYTMNASDGTNQKNLSGSTDGTEPAYSPSGTKIAFVGQGEDEDILVMNASDGSARKNLTNTPPVNGYEVRERGPAYSPSGTKIVFYKETFRQHDVDLYTMHANGTGVRQITDYKGREYSPDWSPNGNRIVFHSFSSTTGTRIFTIKPDGTDRRLVIQDGKDPVWSPNGRKIAFTRDGHTYTVKPDGTGLTEVPGSPQGTAVSEILPNWGPRPASTQQR